MRSVLSISIPAATVRNLKKRAKSKGMTVSAYLVRLVDVEETMISEEELMEDLKQGEMDRKKGNYRTMGPKDSLKDFLPIKK